MKEHEEILEEHEKKPAQANQVGGAEKEAPACHKFPRLKGGCARGKPNLYGVYMEEEEKEIYYSI